MVHETGHLFGCRHNRCSTSNTGGCDNASGYAHGFENNGGNCKSIMHEIEDGTTKLAYFSNPDVNVQGEPIGNADNNNARNIRDTYNTIRDYKYTEILSVNIESENTGTSARLSANVGCGASPYTYSWALSYDGGFNYTNVGNGQSINVTVGCDNIYAQLTVYSSDGQIVSSFATVGGGICGGREGAEESTTEISKVVLEQIYPNPSKDQITINYSLPYEQNISLELIDNLGIIKKSIFSGQQKEGRYFQKVDVKSLNSGIYFIRLQSSEASQSLKISVNQ